MLSDKKGKIPTLSPVNSATIDAQAGAEVKVDLPENHTTILYLLDGEIEILGYGSAEMHHAVLFKNDGDCIAFNVKKNTRMLLLSGLPLNEPMASHGPFVMNNETQLLEAMRDYQMGKMGVLIEE
jgi:redox-sensitive bicupin YhaK (pirin superfamily)